MTTFIQGVNEYPDEFPELDDGVPEQAADWNPSLEALANRTKYLKLKILPVSVLNLNPPATTTFNLARFVYSDPEQTWYGVWFDPGTKQFERSQDNGRTFDDLSTALPSALACYDVACNQSNGNLVIVNAGSRNVFHGVLAGYGSLDTGGNWSTITNGLGAGPTTASIDHDDVNDRFICVYRTGATGFKAEYWDEVAPTFTASAALAAAWTAYTGSNDAEVACSRGQAVCTTVACYFDASGVGHELNVMRSIDGASTWTNQQLTSGAGGDYVLTSKPAYNKENNRWYLAGSSSLPRTEVWESTDNAVTWTSVSVIDGWECHGIVAVGDMLVLLGEDQRVAYSLDRGDTWLFASRALPNGTPTTMFLRAGGGGILIVNKIQKEVWSSVRVGLEGAVL